MRIAADIAETRQSLGSKWTENQMILWSAQLDKFNRTVKRYDSERGPAGAGPLGYPPTPVSAAEKIH